MADHRLPRNDDREALRAVIVDALGDLRESSDPQRAAEDVMRALDAYIETATPAVAEPRELPVIDFSSVPRQGGEARWTLWLVLGCGILATVVAATVLDGGPIAGLVMIGIWIAVLFALVNS